MLDDDARREIEARYPHAKAYRRAGRRERKVRAVIRFLSPYIAVILVLYIVGGVTYAIEHTTAN